MGLQYLHGIETIEVDDGLNTFQTVKSAIIGAIGTAPNRDTTKYAVNEPILIAGDPRSVIDLGAEGTLCDALDSIFRVARPTVIAVVAEAGATLNQTYSNLVGSVAARTGIHTFRKANSILKLTPKLLIAPGYTNQMSADGIASVSVGTGGTGYVVDATNVVFTGGGGHGAVGKVVVNGSGAVQGVVVTKQGFGYQAGTNKAAGSIAFTVNPTVGQTVTVAGTAVTFLANGGSPTGNQVALGTSLATTLTALATFLTGSADAGLASVRYTATTTALNLLATTAGEAGNAIAYSTNVTGATAAGATLSGGFDALAATITGAGTGAAVTAHLGTVANPVVAEMLSIAPYLRAMVLADGPNTTYADAVAYAGMFDSERLIMIDGGVQVFDTIANEPVVRPAAPFAAALQAQVDENEGFWFSFSNRPIPGVVGVGRPIDWSFTDSNVEGQLLNAQGITVVVHDSGFRFMGVRTVTTQTNWQFYAVRRTADMVYETIEQGVRDAIDKPISIGLLSWLEGSVNQYLRQLTRRGALLGGKCFLDPTLNSPGDLKAGHVTASYDLEPPAPMERLTFEAHRQDGYYTDLINTFLRLT